MWHYINVLDNLEKHVQLRHYPKVGKCHFGGENRDLRDLPFPTSQGIMREWKWNGNAREMANTQRFHDHWHPFSQTEKGMNSTVFASYEQNSLPKWQLRTRCGGHSYCRSVIWFDMCPRGLLQPVEGENWDHPSKRIQKWSKLWGGLMVQIKPPLGNHRFPMNLRKSIGRFSIPISTLLCVAHNNFELLTKMLVCSKR